MFAIPMRLTAQYRPKPDRSFSSGGS